MLEIVKAAAWKEKLQIKKAAADKAKKKIDLKVASAQAGKQSTYRTDQYALEMHDIIMRLIDKGKKPDLNVIAAKLNNNGYVTMFGRSFTYANLRTVFIRINKLKENDTWWEN